MRLRGIAGGVAALGIVGAFSLSALPVAAQTAPTAVSDNIAVQEDTPVTIDVLANDEGDGRFIEGVTSPSHGSAAITGGKIRYTPAPDYHGSDTFAYTVSNGGETVGAAVTVLVQSVNDAPTANADMVRTQTGAAKTIDVLANDRDVEGDALTVEIQSDPGHGTLTVDEDTQRVTYVPRTNYSGTDSFTYRVTDGSATSATVTVLIQVEGDGSAAPDTSDGAEDADGTGESSDTSDGSEGTTNVSTSMIGHSPRVLEACDGNPDHGEMQGLCGVYRSFEMPSWARGKIGLVILRLVPKSEEASTDLVTEVCEDTDAEQVQWLCGIYHNEELPEAIQRLVGQRIITVAFGTGDDDAGGRIGNAGDDSDSDE